MQSEDVARGARTIWEAIQIQHIGEGGGLARGASRALDRNAQVAMAPSTPQDFLRASWGSSANSWSYCCVTSSKTLNLSEIHRNDSNNYTG